MRNLALALSVGFLGAVGLTGCGGSNAGSGQLQLTWQIRQGSASGPVVQCAPGETVRVTSGGLSDVFQCTAMAGVTGAIPSGNYDVVVDLLDANGTVESTATLPGVPVRNGALTDLGDVIFVIANAAPGSLSFTWELRGQASGSPVACDPGGNEHFIIDLGGGLTFQASCPPNMSSGSVSVPNVPAGSYTATISVELGTTLESTATLAATVLPGMDTDLGHIIFPVMGAIRRQ